MYKVCMLVMVLAVSFLSTGARAEDGKEQPKPAETKPEVKEVVYEEHEGGFKGFWVHTVGGKIHKGLKKGAGKIEGAF